MNMNNEYSRREQLILKALYENPNFLTTDEIALKSGVSSRTIKSDLKYLKPKLSERGIAIDAKQGKGIRLIVPETEKKWINTVVYADSKEILPYNSAMSRSYRIADHLLSNRTPLTIESLSDTFFMSRGTMLSALTQVEKILNGCHVELRRSCFGLLADGSEQGLRYAGVHVLRRLFPDVLQSEGNQSVKGVRVSDLIEMLKGVEEEVSVRFEDDVFMNILFYLITVIDRYNRRLVKPEGFQQESGADNPVMRMSANLNEKMCRLSLEDYSPADELFRLYYFLKTQSLPEQAAGETDGSHIWRTLVDVVSEADRMFNTELSKDAKLLENLFTHIRHVVFESPGAVTPGNPILHDLKQELAYSFEISLMIAESIKKSTSIRLDENEIGYMAIHVAASLERNLKKNSMSAVVICSGGVGIRELLKARIESLFPQIKVSAIISKRTYEAGEFSGYADFFISTVPLGDRDTNVVYVSPILKGADVTRLSEYVNKLKKSQTDEIVALKKYLHSDISVFGMHAEDKTDVIRRLADLLVENGYGKEDIYRSAMRREEISSTAIGNYIAIPHAFHECVNRNAVAVAVLDRSILWDSENEKVRVVFFLCINFEEREELSVVMREFLTIINSAGTIKLMKEAEDFDGFLFAVDSAGCG